MTQWNLNFEFCSLSPHQVHLSPHQACSCLSFKPTEDLAMETMDLLMGSVCGYSVNHDLSNLSVVFCVNPLGACIDKLILGQLRIPLMSFHSFTMAAPLMDWQLSPGGNGKKAEEQKDTTQNMPLLVQSCGHLALIPRLFCLSRVISWAEGLTQTSLLLLSWIFKEANGLLLNLVK